MNKQHKKPRCDDMYRAILTLKTVEECKQFFDDLCTVTELQAMEQRYQVAQYLDSGLIYNDILEKTGGNLESNMATRSLSTLAVSVDAGAILPVSLGLLGVVLVCVLVSCMPMLYKSPRGLLGMQR